MNSFNNLKNIIKKELEEKDRKANEWLQNDNKNLDDNYIKLIGQIEVLRVIYLEATKEELKNHYRTWDLKYLNERIKEELFENKLNLMIEVKNERIKNNIKGF